MQACSLHKPHCFHLHASPSPPPPGLLAHLHSLQQFALWLLSSEFTITVPGPTLAAQALFL